MSFGEEFSPQKKWIDSAVMYADSKGVLLVHAAGNDAKNVTQQITSRIRILRIPILKRLTGLRLAPVVMRKRVVLSRHFPIMANRKLICSLLAYASILLYQADTITEMHRVPVWRLL